MHIKYRPTSLEQVFGNKDLKTVLRSIRLDRPILLSGHYGCGKTTIARIIAAEFGADEFSITEQDCENLSQVSNMREELTKLNKSSIFGKKRVFILDEIHGLSDKSLKQLLIPLEKKEFIQDVLIIGCTTEINKISKILLSRFIVLQVDLLADNEARSLLDYVLTSEGLQFEKWKKELLILKAEGIPRILLKNINVIKNIDNIDKARYVLEISTLGDIDEDILRLYKLLISNTKWVIIQQSLIELLKTKTPNSIRIGLQNLIGGRLLSSYFNNDTEGIKLINLYNILDREYTIPEKANLIVCLYSFLKI